MQALKSLFTRAQAPRAAARPHAKATQPTELSADSLKLVGGGIPRIGGGGAAPTETPSSTSLPSVG